VNVPNLDGMTADELMQFWAKYHHAGHKLAAELVGDTRKGYIGLAAKLANYASNKATAMMCRNRGDVGTAVLYESFADQIYDDLPADLRW
jgi:hypothetical protein